MKGHDLFVQAAHEVAKRIPEARFLVAGRATKDYMPVLRPLVSRLGIQNALTFMGHRFDLIEIMAGADALVLPSRSEGLGITILEAMAVGTPVVATRVGGIPEIVVDGETGYLVPPDDVPALAEAMLRAVQPENAGRLGRGGQSHVRSSFTIRKMAEETVEVYSRAAEMLGLVAQC